MAVSPEAAQSAILKPKQLRLPIKFPFPPMEARTQDEIPEGEGWLYEPKWDGFRCIAFRDGDKVELQSKAGQPLSRYFPDVVEAMRTVKSSKFVLDGEIVVPIDGSLSFDDLLQRIHPAASRVKMLAETTPALYIAFDLLVDERGNSLVAKPIEDRRPRLERFAKKNFAANGSVRLSPATSDLAMVRKWFKRVGGGLDGIIAKRTGVPYRTGDRTGMVKVKRKRTADCVIGGFRYAEKKKVIGSMLLGLYDDDGLLHHIGFCSSFTATERKELTPKLEALIKPPGFTGQAPGGPSRWATRRSMEWKPLKPKLVAEFEYDHFTNGRFRHGTNFLRWRPDKKPSQCTLDQLGPEKKSPLIMLEPTGRS